MEKAQEAQPSIREQLLVGAGRHINENGLSDLSTRTLSAAGGRSTMCLYTKFKSRSGLLDALYERRAEELLDTLRSAEDPARAYWDAAMASAWGYDFLFSADAATIGFEPSLRSDLVGQVVGALADNDAEGQRRWAILHGMVALVRAGTPRTWADVEPLL